MNGFFLIVFLASVSRPSVQVTRDFLEKSDDPFHSLYPDVFISYSGHFFLAITQESFSTFSFWGLLMLKPYVHTYRINLIQIFGSQKQKSLYKEVWERKKNPSPEIKFPRVICEKSSSISVLHCLEEQPFVGNGNEKIVRVTILLGVNLFGRMTFELELKGHEIKVVLSPRPFKKDSIPSDLR